MTKVKICGITNLGDALAACDAGADALGFNFAPEAKKRGRYVEPEDARRIAVKLPPFVSSVAICVNEPAERLLEYLEWVDWVQLCGEETPDLSEPIARRTIKALRVGPDFDPASMAAYPVRAFVLDARVPGTHGGTGKTCDWGRARDAVASGRNIILAGGLTPENVADAIRAVRPWGVDTASGVESSLGKKDHDRIRNFIRNAKTAL